MHSIQRTLLYWLLSALSLGSLLVALTTYVVTLEEMHEVFDVDLQNFAEAVEALHQTKVTRQSDPSIPVRTSNDASEDAGIIMLTWTPDGVRMFASDSRVQISFKRTEGLHRETINGEEWIVYTVVRKDGMFQAAQRQSTRQELASESASKVFPPLIGLTLMIAGLLVFGLRKGLLPLDDVANNVARRTELSLEPIHTKDVPKEVLPLVSAINALMARLGYAVGAQRRFLADAAHELRTPLTALRLQLQLLEKSIDERDRKDAMTELMSGINRSQRLVEQLLQYARAETNEYIKLTTAVDLSQIVREVVSALSIKAQHLNLDIGVKIDNPVIVYGNAEQLSILITNLVDNALRYTPTGGVIDVEVDFPDGVPTLRVQDTGPGIPKEEKSKVFDRFYRGKMAHQQTRDGLGSGLGLSIVKAVADLHGATVLLLNVAGSGTGLIVEVSFPAETSSASALLKS